MFTGARFPDFSDHPRLIQFIPGLASDAAGRYQFLSTTWDGLRLGDFSPKQNQDHGAVELIRQRGALQLIELADFGQH
jgi:muramidase (phage lysozyme)